METQTAAGKSVQDQCAELKKFVDEHPGNTVRLYKFLQKDATLPEIATYLKWLAQQGPYNEYLRLWMKKVPQYIYDAYYHHIDEEETGDHSGLFRKMMRHLDAVAPVTIEVDRAAIDALNYTFSPQAVEEQDYGYFIGSFYATEETSPIRCTHILDGLKRHGTPPEALEFLELHVGADAEHGDEVLRDMIAPVLAREPAKLASIRAGAVDRLQRATNFLDWYADRIRI